MFVEEYNLRLYLHAMRITLLFALILTHCLVQADTLTGRVVRVTDGDTIVVLDSSQAQHKNRLTGIDAPERKQACANETPLGRNGTAEDVAKGILFLSSNDAAGFITGEYLAVNGGLYMRA